jgi:molybdate transport system substrate-binding protein
MRRRRAFAALALAILAQSGGVRAEPRELRLGAAASLRDALTEIVRLYEAEWPGARARVVFAASSVLAAQIRAGAPLDLFLSADERIVDALVAEGWVTSPTPFASNRLAILVSRDLAGPLATPRDLLGPEVRRIAIPEHAVPVGRYARQWLARHGLADALRGRTVRTEHARATLTAVDQGHVDVAIVYASDARLARSARVPFEIPLAEQPRIAYSAAIVQGAPDPQAARAFLRLLRSPAAADALGEKGFAAPPAGDAGSPS